MDIGRFNCFIGRSWTLKIWQLKITIKLDGRCLFPHLARTSKIRPRENWAVSKWHFLQLQLYYKNHSSIHQDSAQLNIQIKFWNETSQLPYLFNPASCSTYPQHVLNTPFKLQLCRVITYLNLCAWWWRGPGYRLFGDWYSCERIAWLVFWLGLLANLTVIGSVAFGGFCPFKPLIASSASTLLSNRIKPTPLDTP